MPDRDTTWDEEDTTTDRPLLPGGQQAQIDFIKGLQPVRQLFESGVDVEIQAMTEARRSVNRLVASIPQIREENGRLIIPVAYEKMVLVKRIVLVEEIVLSPEYRSKPGK